MSYTQYNFKRDFFYEAENAIENSSITFITGPKKCGKTVCLRQLADADENALYINMKYDFDTDEKRNDVVSGVINSIANGQKIVYLIDDAEYMALPDKDIAKIAGAYSKYDNQCTKVVFTGGHSELLEFWGHIACGGNASFIRAGFLSYSEWLSFKGITEISERSYADFLHGCKEFCQGFDNTEKYLQNYLDETAELAEKPIEYITGAEAESVDVNTILNVLCSSIKERINKADISENHIGNLEKSVHISNYDCKNAIRFLSDNKLATLTYITDEPTADPYITQKFLKPSNELYRDSEVFSRLRLTAYYPMFCIDLIKNTIKVANSDKISDDILRIIVTGHIRSLLSCSGVFEYENSPVSTVFIGNSGYSVEVLLSDDIALSHSLDSVPEDYEKIILTRSREEALNNVRLIPYYRFIFDKSDNRKKVQYDNQ